ncbi:MAG: cytochrome c biogenesis protein CcsA [Armatimonadota bacterium]
MATAATITMGLASAIYFVAGVLYQGQFFRRWRAYAQWGARIVAAGAAVHAVALVLHGLTVGRLPLTSVWESLSFFAWLTVVVYLYLEWRMGMPLIGAFAVPLAFLAILCAALALPKGLPRPPEMNVWFLVVHVTPAFLSYVAFLLAFCVALLYLMQAGLLKAKRLGRLQRALPSLEQLDGLGYRLVALGFPLLTLGIVAGAIWYGETTGGNYWSWLTQEPGPMITWLVYAIYLHARLVAGWQRGRITWLLVAGFVIVVVTYVVAHPFLPGPHNLPTQTTSLDAL